MRLILVLLGSALLVVACSSHSTENTGTQYQLLDTKVACDTEDSWPTPQSQACGDCIGQSQIAPCSCQPGIPHRGDCQTEATAHADEPDCNDILLNRCILACGLDCACKDTCYQGHTACRNAEGVLESCVVSACSSTCAP